jgi:TolB-like protein
MDESGKSGESGSLHSAAGHAELGAPRRVFISYASHDAVIAQAVCSALEAAGFTCWIAPRDVVPGTLYAEGIVRALDESKVLVVVLSEQAVASAHVGRELERAAAKKHPIIALRADAAPLTPAFEYFLNQSQWIEVGAGGADGAVAKLVEAVGRHLAPGSAAVASQTHQAPVRKRPIWRQRWSIAAAVVVLALVAGYFWVGKAWLHGNTAAVPIADKSIAVLPFVDMSEKKDQEYFADGMAEEIINLLVEIPGLKVIGRTSSFQFKGKTEDLRSIGTQLGVAYVLEGSVRKSGDRLRVTAQLINSRDGTHLLSQTYDRDLIDVLKIQDEIAIKVAQALEIEVGFRDYFASRPGLGNAEAYTLYLQAAHDLNRYDRRGWEQAVSAEQRALDLDPTFAEAAGGLASAYQFAGQVGYVTPAVAFEKSRDAAKLALKLNPNLAYVHALLGDIYGAYAWDWAAADKEIRLALGIAPNDQGVVWAAMRQSSILGRWDDALRFANELQELDPLDEEGYFWLGLIQLPRGQFSEAEAAARRAVELSPTAEFRHYTLGQVLLARSQPEAALAEMQKETHDGARLAGSAMAYFALNRKAESDAALAQMLKSYGYIPSGVAGIYAFRGESNEAFKWLDLAYAQKDPLLFRIKYSWDFNNLHSDPRYKAFLKQMNLPE